MAKNARRFRREITVMEVSGDIDERQFLDTIIVIAASGVAYVRDLGTPDVPTYCISNVPLTLRQALKAATDHEAGIGRCEHCGGVLEQTENSKLLGRSRPERP